MAKPTGAICNLACSYCFFLDKEELYPGSGFRMEEEVLERYVRQLIESHRSDTVTFAWQGGEPTLMGLDFFRRAMALQERYRRPGLTRAEAQKYTRFIIDPVMIWYAPTSDYKGIFPDELKAITDYFRSTAVNELKSRHAVVTEPGPGVVRIRAAIVDMHRENPVHLYQFTPVGLVLTGVKEASGMDDITRARVAAGNSYIISGTIEVGFYDSVSNELLGAFRDSTRVGPERQQAGGATWGQVKDQLDAWARKLRARVDAAQEVR
jgi:hypothetical protein